MLYLSDLSEYLFKPNMDLLQTRRMIEIFLSHSEKYRFNAIHRCKCYLWKLLRALRATFKCSSNGVLKLQIIKRKNHVYTSVVMSGGTYGLLVKNRLENTVIFCTLHILLKINRLQINPKSFVGWVPEKSLYCSLPSQFNFAVYL